MPKRAWADDVKDLPIDLVRSDPVKTRDLDDDKVQELMKSIKKKGLQQPIGVRPMEDGAYYLVVFGEHRREAFSRLGLPTIPAKVLPIDEREALELKETENAHRNNFVNPWMQGQIFARALRDYYDGNVDDMAEAIGKTTNYIQERTRVFHNLDESLIKFVGNKLTSQNAINIARIDNKEAQRKVADKIIASRTVNLFQYRGETGYRQPLNIKPFTSYGLGYTGGKQKVDAEHACPDPECGAWHRIGRQDKATAELDE